MKLVNIVMKAHRQIAKFDKADMALVYKALELLKNWPKTSNVKKRVDMPGYRFHMGQYRALFDVAGDTVTVMDVRKWQ